MLTKEEILENWNMFVGSQATNYGEDLTKNHDELWFGRQRQQRLRAGFLCITTVTGCVCYMIFSKLSPPPHKAALLALSNEIAASFFLTPCLCKFPWNMVTAHPRVQFLIYPQLSSEYMHLEFSQKLQGLGSKTWDPQKHKTCVFKGSATSTVSCRLWMPPHINSRLAHFKLRIFSLMCGSFVLQERFLCIQTSDSHLKFDVESSNKWGVTDCVQLPFILVMCG